MKDREKLIVFDTTLRDGEQCPGAAMNKEEKLAVASMLKKLNVDVIEAGFAAASQGDFDAISEIAKNIDGPTICSLARARENDIELAGNAVKHAKNKRIHVFIATSPIHRKYKLKMSQEEVLENIKKSVSFAKKFVDDVEYSAEDATRTEKEFLYQAIETAIKAGATTVNIPDTVGYAIPSEYRNLIEGIINNVSNIDKAVISAHCQNDLGLATANSLAGILAGVRQVECTINGIGERAGNAALEEVVMAIKTRSDYFPVSLDIDTKVISRISKLVSNITNFPIQYNKAIVGSNAFAHESGIHQDGMLKNRDTYEIMKPEDVGIEKTTLVLGKHSGRAALMDRMRDLGYNISEDQLQDLFAKFKNLADKKKEILDDDLILLMDDSILKNENQYKLADLSVMYKKSEIEVDVVIEKDGNVKKAKINSNTGPINALFNAIKLIIPHDYDLDLYHVNAAGSGSDAQAVITVRLKNGERSVSSTASDTDTIRASAICYINCINKILSDAKF